MVSYQGKNKSDRVATICYMLFPEELIDNMYDDGGSSMRLARWNQYQENLGLNQTNRSIICSNGINLTQMKKR